IARSECITDQVDSGLRDEDCSAAITASEPAGQIITMHTAKGMELERAIIVGAGAEEIPAAWQLADLPDSEQHDVELRERSLLYVAATRARDELVITLDWRGIRLSLGGFVASVSARRTTASWGSQIVGINHQRDRSAVH